MFVLNVVHFLYYSFFAGFSNDETENDRNHLYDEKKLYIYKNKTKKKVSTRKKRSFYQLEMSLDEKEKKTKKCLNFTTVKTFSETIVGASLFLF